MWLTLAWDAVSFGVKCAIAHFTLSPDRKLGQLETADKEKADALTDIKKAVDAANAVKLRHAGVVSTADPNNRDN